MDSSGKEFEQEVSVNKIGKYLSESAEIKSDNLGAHLAVLKRHPEVISNSLEAEVHLDYQKNNRGKRDSSGVPSGGILVHRFYGAVEIEVKTYRVKTTIPEQKGLGIEPHSYQVTKIEMLDTEPSIKVEPKLKAINSQLSLGPAKLGNNSEVRKLSGKNCLQKKMVMFG